MVGHPELRTLHFFKQETLDSRIMQARAGYHQVYHPKRHQFQYCVLQAGNYLSKTTQAVNLTQEPI
jgi:hypothetical protein